eukprot:m.350851 g.350851  ORF g.350851 m.350851 type:complete len:61 (+) comp16160_c0_seq7:3409-3591(+)
MQNVLDKLLFASTIDALHRQFSECKTPLEEARDPTSHLEGINLFLEYSAKHTLSVSVSVL